MLLLSDVAVSPGVLQVLPEAAGADTSRTPPRGLYLEVSCDHTRLMETPSVNITLDANDDLHHP